jgi:salicylate hydroxylase
MESDFIIVGAGIGGLSAALALGPVLATTGAAPGSAMAPATPPISVLEQADSFTEAGAGIQLGPNAVRLLHGWGLQAALDAVAARPNRLQALDARDGRSLAVLRLGEEFRQRYGADYLTLHRADLHQLMLQALDPLLVRTNCASSVASVTQEAGCVSVSTRHGASHRAAALVACDGLWSPVREQLLQDGPPQPTGHVAYRAMLEIGNVPRAVERGQVTVWLGPRLHVVAYPVRRAELMNLVVVLQGPGAPADASGVQGWDMDSDGQACLHALRDQHPALLDLAQAVPPDPMRPYLAQGAAMALEDAQALALALSGSPHDVAAALRHYAQSRWQRNARVQRKSRVNGTIFHARGALRLARNLALRLAGARLMETPWLYGPSAGPG